MAVMAKKNVIIFGIGGVGSWTAESLVRTGIRKLTMVDSDRICVTNINRQVHATTQTVGEVKTDVLKKRLLEINPSAEITNLQKIFNKETQDQFELDSYDYIIDAIDSLINKIYLIRFATRTNARFFSSMGSALKVDPTRIRVGKFWEIQGCPFAAMIRSRIRRGELPAKEFLCVYSDEVLKNAGADPACGTEKCFCPKSKNGPGDAELASHEWCSMKAAVNGSTAHITAIFGFTLAGLVIKDIYDAAQTSPTS